MSIKRTFPHFNIQDSGAYKYHNSYTPAHWNWRYDGGFYDPLWNPAWDTMSDLDYSISEIFANSELVPDLSDLGAGAYARLRPSPERAGLAVAMAEAKDLPRMLQQTAGSFANYYRTIGGNSRSLPMAPKKVSEDFLNAQFGWIPFLKDIRDLDSAYRNSKIHMAQISRDNGKWVRRRRADKVLETETVVYSRDDIAGCSPVGFALMTNMTVGPKSYTVKLQDYTEVWYEGVFKYYRPEFDANIPSSHEGWAAINRHMTVYGAHINPVVIWKATPWSWLGDWFTNAGDAIQRAQDWATDSMVSKYMYLMHHRRRRFELNSRFTTADGQLHSLYWYREADIKRRQQASSSFSFVLSGGLSPRQIAILAALGISRTP